MKKRAVCTGIISGVVIVMGIVLAGMLRWKLEWEPESNTETNIFLANAERGFYNMRGVMISDAQPVEEWVYESIRAEQPDETIELLQIHIGHYGSTEISAAGLEQIRKTFDAYAERKHQVRLIVRFLYDWDGNGAGSDPSSINIVLRHMEQLGEIVSEYEDQIYIVQGVLVGSWAEIGGARGKLGGDAQFQISDGRQLSDADQEDGRDDAGLRVPCGAYSCILADGGRQERSAQRRGSLE